MLTLIPLVAAASEFTVPEVQADLLRPGVGPAPGIAASAPLEGALGSAAAVWTRAPLVWQTADGASADVLRHVVALHLAAAAGFGRWIGEVDGPVYLAATSELGPGAPVFAGDPQLGLRVVPLAGARGSASLYGRVIPTFGASAHALGESGVSGSVGASASWDPGSGPALGADVSLWLRRAATADGATFGGDALSIGVFGRRPLGPVDGTASARGLVTLDDPGAAPVEALLGLETHGITRVQVAVGTGVHAGIGAPSSRVLVGVATGPR